MNHFYDDRHDHKMRKTFPDESRSDSDKEENFRIFKFMAQDMIAEHIAKYKARLDAERP